MLLHILLEELAVMSKGAGIDGNVRVVPQRRVRIQRSVPQPLCAMLDSTGLMGGNLWGFRQLSGLCTYTYTHIPSASSFGSAGMPQKEILVNLKAEILLMISSPPWSVGAFLGGTVKL